jgi:hypothetical protein
MKLALITDEPEQDIEQQTDDTQSSTQVALNDSDSGE